MSEIYYRLQCPICSKLQPFLLTNSAKGELIGDECQHKVAGTFLFGHGYIDLKPIQEKAHEIQETEDR